MSMPLDTQPVGVYLEAMASAVPSPGGGSAAALSGAMAAGLVSMVCSITAGKPQYAEIEDEVRGIHVRSEELRLRFQRLADEDATIFARLSSAYRLPRTTDADAASRQAAIQQVTRLAAEAPMRTARTAVELLPLCTALAPRVGRLIVADIGVAVVLARATVQSAILNVEINLAGLEDQRYVREARARIEDLIVGLSEEAEGILAIVRGRINQ